MPKFYDLQDFLKAAAISGIFMAWANFTIEAFKFSRHIISTSPEKETCKAVTKVMCAECKHFFNDESEDEPYICLSCQGIPNLKKNLSIYHV